MAHGNHVKSMMRVQMAATYLHLSPSKAVPPPRLEHLSRRVPHILRVHSTQKMSVRTSLDESSGPSLSGAAPSTEYFTPDDDANDNHRSLQSHLPGGCTVSFKISTYFHVIQII